MGFLQKGKDKDLNEMPSVHLLHIFPVPFICPLRSDTNNNSNYC